MNAHPTLDVRVHGLDPDFVEYDAAWALQRDLHAQRVNDEIKDTVLLLEHPAVFTAGRRTEDFERPMDGTPVVDVDRGGKITWHGPGQLVGYPILRLPMPIDLVKYVRRLEDVLIAACDDVGLATMRVDGRTGVWLPADPERSLPERKVAAIGVRVARGVTMHGFALNCDNSLDGFNAIVPCGIADAGVTTLTNELNRTITPRDMADPIEQRLVEFFGRDVALEAAS